MVKTARHWRKAYAVPLILILVLAMSGCEGKPSREKHAKARPEVPLLLAIAPAENAQQVPVSAEIGLQVSGGEITDVTLADSQNNRITGKPRQDNSSWVPGQALRYGTTYTATVKATGEGGKTETKTTTFTTMAEPRGRQVETSVNIDHGGVYGVAMPIVVTFDREVQESDRAGIEKRLFVTSDPPQPGVWAWFSGTQVLYRGPEYWQPGTKVSIRAGLGGHPLSGNRFGDADHSATGAISNTKTYLSIDNASKQMSVWQDDKLVRSLPVSLGKPRTPTSSGSMVIMEKAEDMVFDTRSEPNPADRYVVPVRYAQRLTLGGEFIHAAPWSVGDQGRRNVSHGCTNVSMANAAWLFAVTRVGDPVVIRGTEYGLDPGNGWTGWDVTWEQHVKRSALPHPEFAPPTPSPSPGQSSSPDPSPVPDSSPAPQGGP